MVDHGAMRLDRKAVEEMMILHRYVLDIEKICRPKVGGRDMAISHEPRAADAVPSSGRREEFSTRQGIDLSTSGG